MTRDGGPLPARPLDDRPDGAVIRVLLAEDMHLVRHAVAFLLNLEPDLEVVAEVGDGRSAVEEAIRHRPDVAVVDLDMPFLDGWGVTAELARVLPSCAVLILTGIARPTHLRMALERGAKAFVQKDVDHATLAELIRQVHKGTKYVDPVLAAAALVAPPCPLTARELDILRLAAQGASAPEIARDVHLAAGTVRNYLVMIVGKLGVTNRAEAIRVAQENDWL